MFSVDNSYCCDHCDLSICNVVLFLILMMYCVRLSVRHVRDCAKLCKCMQSRILKSKHVRECERSCKYMQLSLPHEHAVQSSLRQLPAVHRQVLSDRPTKIYCDLMYVLVVYVGLHGTLKSSINSILVKPLK